MRDTWGAPEKGWPTFGPDGKVVKERPLRRCGLRHTGPCPWKSAGRDEVEELIGLGPFAEFLDDETADG